MQSRVIVDLTNGGRSVVPVIWSVDADLCGKLANNFLFEHTMAFRKVLKITLPLAETL